MRLARTLLVLAALVGASARADDAPTVVLEVGETWSRPGSGARCDDLSVADITVNGFTITARKPGRTICGWAVGHAGGARTWVNVVVVEKGQKKEQAEPGKK
ncbi:MAG: hypothetical protein QM704_02325 [Anaeromyxobacteraceae bacterium]